MPESASEEVDDYVIKEGGSKRKDKEERKRHEKDDTFMPLNVYDLYEQANAQFSHTSARIAYKVKDHATWDDSDHEQPDRKMLHKREKLEHIQSKE